MYECICGVSENNSKVFKTVIGTQGGHFYDAPSTEIQKTVYRMALIK